MVQDTDIRQVQSKDPPISIAKAYYVLALLTLVWAFQFANIHIVNVVLERIRSEFRQSDTVMGLIAGIAVVLFGSILSMPVARLADRKGRIAIISIGVTFWSIMTTLGGFAQSIVQLLLARIGYSIGGSVSPGPGNSLAADYFPRSKLPMAMALMSTAPCVGGLIASWIGGIVGTAWGWRGAFIAVGIPGFVIAGLLYFTVKEPIRGIQDGKHADTRNYGIGETLRFFIENKTYFLVVVGFTFTGFADLALSTWFVPYLERVHHKTMLEASTFGGTITALGSLAGVLLGGAVIGYLGKKNDKWKIVGPGITSLLAGPMLLCFLFAPMPWSYVGAFFSMLLMGFRMGPILGLVQTVVKVRMRAFAAATLFLIGTLIGSGGGPLLIGALNDYLNVSQGTMAIRYSLLCVPVASMLGALFFIYAGRYVTEDIRRSRVD
jgi:MFS family permease